MYRLHDVLQGAMGWEDKHLHMFETGDKLYGPPDAGLDDVEDETGVCLWEIAPREGDRFIYTYDFGDGWRHDVVVERIEEAGAALRGTALCMDGARACPPEDCGGPGGYGDLLRALSDPGHERHREILEWVGGEFDPETFSLSEVNGRLNRLRLSRQRKTKQIYH